MRLKVVILFSKSSLCSYASMVSFSFASVTRDGSLYVFRFLRGLAAPDDRDDDGAGSERGGDRHGAVGSTHAWNLGAADGKRLR